MPEDIIDEILLVNMLSIQLFSHPGLACVEMEMRGNKPLVKIISSNNLMASPSILCRLRLKSPIIYKFFEVDFLTIISNSEINLALSPLGGL